MAKGPATFLIFAPVVGVWGTWYWVKGGGTCCAGSGPGSATGVCGGWVLRRGKAMLARGGNSG